MTQTSISPHEHAVLAPLIVYPGSYFDKDQEIQAGLERLKKLKANSWDQKATEYEILIYLMSVAHVVPPPSRYFNAIQYLFRRYFGEEMANDIGMDSIGELGYVEKNLIEGLATWIYRKQVEHLKPVLNLNLKHRRNTVKIPQR